MVSCIGREVGGERECVGLRTEGRMDDRMEWAVGEDGRSFEWERERAREREGEGGRDSPGQ